MSWLARALATGVRGDSKLVSVVNLRFGHPGTAAPLLDGFCLDLPAGARCLLVGANGAGEWG